MDSVPAPAPAPAVPFLPDVGYASPAPPTASAADFCGPFAPEDDLLPGPAVLHLRTPPARRHRRTGSQWSDVALGSGAPSPTTPPAAQRQQHPWEAGCDPAAAGSDDDAEDCDVIYTIPFYPSPSYAPGGSNSGMSSSNVGSGSSGVSRTSSRAGSDLDMEAEPASPAAPSSSSMYLEAPAQLHQELPTPPTSLPPSPQHPHPLAQRVARYIQLHTGIREPFAAGLAAGFAEQEELQRGPGEKRIARGTCVQDGAAVVHKTLTFLVDEAELQEAEEETARRGWSPAEPLPIGALTELRGYARVAERLAALGQQAMLVRIRRWGVDVELDSGAVSGMATGASGPSSMRSSASDQQLPPPPSYDDACAAGSCPVVPRRTVHAVRLTIETEWAPGGSLSRALDRLVEAAEGGARPNLRLLLSYQQAQTELLVVLEAAGLILPDLKPANMVLTADGRLALIDVEGAVLLQPLAEGASQEDRRERFLAKHATPVMTPTLAPAEQSNEFFEQVSDFVQAAPRDEDERREQQEVRQQWAPLSQLADEVAAGCYSEQQLLEVGLFLLGPGLGLRACGPMASLATLSFLYGSGLRDVLWRLQRVLGGRVCCEDMLVIARLLRVAAGCCATLPSRRTAPEQVREDVDRLCAQCAADGLLR